MIQFWSSRSPRERMLILAAAVIVGLLLLSTSVVRPLRAAHLEASTMLLKSASTLELVDQAAQSARAEGKARPRLSDAELRTALVELARRRGIEISRLQTRDDGNIVLQIETAPAPLVFAWLMEAEQSFNASPVRANMSEDGAGTVRASVEFEGGQP